MRSRIRSRLQSLVEILDHVVLFHLHAELLQSIRLQVLGRHANHGRLFLFGVQELDDTARAQLLPAKLVLLALGRVEALVGQPADHVLGQVQRTLRDLRLGVVSLLHHEQGPHHTPCIGKYLELAVTNVAYQRYLGGDDARPASRLHLGD